LVRGWYRRVGICFVALTAATAAFPEPARAAATHHAFVLGDSVTVGATPSIQTEAPARGWTVVVDAKVGRTTAEGASILAAMQGRLPAVVVVALGNNDGAIPALFARRIDAVMQQLVGVRDVVWYTMTPFASWVPAANAELRSAAGRWKNLQLADWSTVSTRTPGALVGAGPHLRAPGAQMFADLLFATLDHFGGGTPVVESFGGRRPNIVTGTSSSEAPRAMATALNGADLWFATPGGHVQPRRGTRSYGSLRSRPRAPIVAMSSTPSGKGYWLASSDGHVFSFGDARPHGSAGALRLVRPIVGMSATRSGKGYWLVAADGGIFSFGDARFHGSTGAVTLHQPIVGMSATRSGKGYWLVAADGGIFSFGDARFYGSTGGMRLQRPIVGMSPIPSGRGYWMVASDGGVFSFGHARYCGSGIGLHATTGAFFVGIAPAAHGYVLGAVMGGERS
jgi:hypothetical protein